MVYHKDTNKRANKKHYEKKSSLLFLAVLFFIFSECRLLSRFTSKVGIIATQQKERPLHHIRAEGVCGEHHVEVAADYLDIGHALFGGEVARSDGATSMCSVYD